jgi:hypothetical protein
MLFLLAVATLAADEPLAARRLREAKEFSARAVERTGVLIPLYIYPGDVLKNPAYNRIIDLRRRFETVPMWVIVNPASGPGEKADANYTAAIARLRGAGCVVLGYVTTSYAKRRAAAVKKDIDAWLKLYPRVHGVFFDEMAYADTDAGAKHQAALRKYAHDAGLWPTVGNPGADTPPRYFDAQAADVIVVHEGGDWPKEGRFDRYAEHPPFTRGVLVHSQEKFDRAALRTARRHARWVYVTEGLFRPGDPKAANPWGRVSKHLEALCEELSGK